MTTKFENAQAPPAPVRAKAPEIASSASSGGCVGVWAGERGGRAVPRETKAGRETGYRTKQVVTHAPATHHRFCPFRGSRPLAVGTRQVRHSSRQWTPSAQAREKKKALAGVDKEAVKNNASGKRDREIRDSGVTD